VKAYFELVEHGYQSWTVSGDQRLLTLASRATEALWPHVFDAELRIRPRQPTGRVRRPLSHARRQRDRERRGGSYTLLPEVQHKPAENLELRLLANIQRGVLWTEFGEKQADVRLEFRVRYSF
jgi:hypothetical protein